MNNILFIGGRKKGFRILKELLQSHMHVVHAYILNEDEHEIEKFSSRIAELCQENNISATFAKSVKKNKDAIQKLNPDLIVVAGWRTIIPKEIVSIPMLGCIAFHESLLPKYRGFAPINWAIINGEKNTGVTLFYLDEKIDHGDIIGQKEISIEIQDTAYNVYNKSIEASVSLITTHLPSILARKVQTRAQNDAEASYACTRTPEDGKIDWSKSADTIFNLIRGLSYPYSGAFCFYRGKKIIIEQAKLVHEKKWIGSIPGRIGTIYADNNVEICTGGDRSLLITAIRVDGDVVSPGSFITSPKDTLT